MARLVLATSPMGFGVLIIRGLYRWTMRHGEVSTEIVPGFHNHIAEWWRKVVSMDKIRKPWDAAA